MASVLYITANPMDETHSCSLAVGKAFIDGYRKAAPADHILHLDLFKADIPAIDAAVFSGWGKLRAGSGFAELTGEEQRKVGRLDELLAQFMAADKYVFVTPVWNFSFPPVVKAYIDAVCVAGKTFRFTERGPIGLLTDKKGLHIQASGGVLSEGPAARNEFSHSYLATVMNFLGVRSFEGLFVEGHHHYPDRAAEIKAMAIARASEMAKQFAAELVCSEHIA